jgi:hypothetical protein
MLPPASISWGYSMSQEQLCASRIMLEETTTHWLASSDVGCWQSHNRACGTTKVGSLEPYWSS